jgi:hypothetical protein
MVRHKKNRKKDSEGFIFPAPFAAILGAVALVSLGYLWFCGRCEALGAQIKMLENRKVEAHKRVLNEQCKWSNMKSPGNILALLQSHNLSMTYPEESRVVRLRYRSTESASLRDSAERRDYVQRAGTAVND